MRGYLQGLMYGGAAMVLGLGGLSYVMPARVEMPPPPATAAAPIAAAADPAPVPAAPTPVEPAVTTPVVPAPTLPAPTLPEPEPAPAPLPAAEPAPPAPSLVPEAPKPSTLAANPPLVAAAPLAIAPEIQPATAAAPAAPAAMADQPPVQPPVQNPQGGLAPLQAFAAPFGGAGGKPLFAIVLLDIGHPEIDRAVVASMPQVVSFAVDPESPFAAEAMAIYRAAGKEVIMLPTSLPKGGTAPDVEQSMAAYAQMLPESVAVMSAPEAGFQDDRALAGLVVPAVGSQGRGLLVFDKGLNSAGQIAQREGVPYASIAKIIDAAGESVPVMRRYLDRTVFSAAQEGVGVVMGTMQPDTLAALTEWTLEGKASEVTLAPISALMQPAAAP